MRILHWFRKDLRLADNTALAAAARDSSDPVLTVYVSAPTVLARADHAAVRLQFALDALAALRQGVADAGGRLIVRHGDAATELLRLAREAQVDAVYFNAEYEPDLAARDTAVAVALGAAGVTVRRFHDRFLVPPGAVRTGAGSPYTVYTPFRRACEKVPVPGLEPAVTRLAFPELPTRRLATLAELGSALTVPAWPAGEAAGRRALEAFIPERVFDYANRRDRMAEPGTSRLSHHLRFGTVSARQVYHAALDAVPHAPHRSAGPGDKTPTQGVETYVAELRWRDFYGHVLHHFPHVVEGAFRPDYDRVRWVNDRASFEAWCQGRTGYPIVDAAMRELRATGWMHNRSRMIVASFLTKDLLCDWRWGERWFMNHLVDGDPASNNGGWQWAASTGTDAQPWFRVFNPVLQGKRFDPAGGYVRRWVPELAGLPDALIHEPWNAAPLELGAAGVTLDTTYPAPICDHQARKALAVALYREAAPSERRT